MADTGIVHTARSVAAFQMQLRAHGAILRDRTPVTGLSYDDAGVTVRTGADDVRAKRIVLATDALTNELLGPLGVEIPLVPT